MVENAEDYYWTMAARERLIMVQQGGSISALCTFFILPDETYIQDYYDRKCWSLPFDVDDGSTVYVDKLLSYVPWTHELATMVETVITERVPSWQTAVWYRPRHGDLPDRRYTLTRRRRPDGTDLHG